MATIVANIILSCAFWMMVYSKLFILHRQWPQQWTFSTWDLTGWREILTSSQRISRRISTTNCSDSGRTSSSKSRARESSVTWATSRVGLSNIHDALSNNACKWTVTHFLQVDQFTTWVGCSRSWKQTTRASTATTSHPTLPSVHLNRRPRPLTFRSSSPKSCKDKLTSGSLWKMFLVGLKFISCGLVADYVICMMTYKLLLID